MYRRYFGRRGEDAIVQIVVPKELREKVVSLAHDTLLAGPAECSKSSVGLESMNL